jgi:hypothetical protein
MAIFNRFLYVYQRVNLHFPMVFHSFLYVYQRVAIFQEFPPYDEFTIQADAASSAMKSRSAASYQSSSGADSDRLAT